jgi:hypothetical protein
LDKTSVNLGTTVVDERLYQSITLRNNGALGTNYRLVKTSLLRNEQTKNQVKDNNNNNKEEIRTEVSTSSLEKETSTISGLIKIKF